MGHCFSSDGWHTRLQAGYDVNNNEWRGKGPFPLNIYGKGSLKKHVFLQQRISRNSMAFTSPGCSHERPGTLGPQQGTRCYAGSYRITSGNALGLSSSSFWKDLFGEIVCWELFVRGRVLPSWVLPPVWPRNGSPQITEVCDISLFISEFFVPILITYSSEKKRLFLGYLIEIYHLLKTTCWCRVSSSWIFLWSMLFFIYNRFFCV